MKGRYFIYLLILCVLSYSCEKRSPFDFSHFYENIEIEYEKYHLEDSSYVIDGFPYKITFYPESREDVMIGNLDQGEISLTYLNVLKVNSSYILVYNCVSRNYLFGRNLGDMEIRSKISSDGLFLDNEIPYNIIAGSGSRFGIKSGMEQCLFYDDINGLYKIIYNQQEAGTVKMFMIESKDCVNWGNRTLIIEQFYDSQYSVKVRDGKYFVYHRLWIDGIRVVGLTVLSTNGEILEPARVLYISDNKYFNHIYNIAASEINPTYDLCFPTKYNSVTNEISVNLGYIYETENVFVSDYNLIKILSRKNEAKWISVCPGLLPTDSPNEYWLYYHLSFKEHGSQELRASKYCRIKLKLENLQ